jgi:nucleotide-binding universal stress UspA family protein
VVSEIVRHATESHADLIVMGTHGRSGFDRMLLGSATERTLAKAPCAVLTIPPKTSEPGSKDARFHRVLCAVDFSPSSVLALTQARNLAADDAKVWAVHVVEREPAFQLVPAMATGAPDDPLVIMRTARERLSKVVSVAAPGGQVSEIVTDGDAADEIVRSAADVHADLIVIGAHAGHAGLLGFGSTTNHVIRAASCPVLTLKA